MYNHLAMGVPGLIPVVPSPNNAEFITKVYKMCMTLKMRKYSINFFSLLQKCQYMSHAVTYSNFCKDLNF